MATFASNFPSLLSLFLLNIFLFLFHFPVFFFSGRYVWSSFMFTKCVTMCVSIHRIVSQILSYIFHLFFVYFINWLCSMIPFGMFIMRKSAWIKNSTIRESRRLKNKQFRKNGHFSKQSPEMTAGLCWTKVFIHFRQRKRDCLQSFFRWSRTILLFEP